MKLKDEFNQIKPLNQQFIDHTKTLVKKQLDDLAIDATDGAMDEDRKSKLLDIAAALSNASSFFLAAHETCEQLSDEINTQIKEYTKWHQRLKKKRRWFKPTEPNSEIDYQEKITNHFTRGLNFYKLFWIFFIGCIGGVIIETIFCLITRGHYESRVGLVIGPFNLVYGLGALALTMALYKFRNRSASHAFVGGFIVGSIIEYLCSLFQEMVFGSVSWDYSRFPFNVDGRICLLYSIFWGILGIIWIKVIYPRMSVWILLIPNKIGKITSWILLVFMLFDSLFTGIVVYRWTQRMDGMVATNTMETWIDQHYDDQTMEDIFPNMMFIEE